jgi:alkaline phosphatase
MIGDGMGTTQVYSGMAAKEGPLNLEQCQYVGFQKTYSHNSDITDSGASASAMATGVKTRNGSVSVDPEGVAVKTILEYAEDKELSSGILATCAITHATPAAFAAHNIERDNEEDIALDMIHSGVDVMIGGGRMYFSDREDGANLLDTLLSMGYLVGEGLDDIPGDATGPIVVFTDHAEMPSATNGRGDVLPRATALAIQKLSVNPEGFFLIVEGSMIDWSAHEADTEGLIAEMLDFDNAIGEAINFAKKDGETLVIVTGDHETGGFAIFQGGPKNKEVIGNFATDDHTGVMIPVFAFGPGAESFAGIYENTDIFEKMKSLLGL